MYDDPVKQVQEEFLQQLYLLRHSFAAQIEKVCQSGGGIGSGSVPAEKYQKVADENKKLKYRIKHLLRALEDQEGGSSAKSVSGAYKIFTDKKSFDLGVSQTRIVGALCGHQVELVFLSEEEVNSKDMKTQNPSGQFPFIETPKGALFGSVAISLFFAEQANKMLGKDAVQTAQIEQWINWATNTLSPTCSHVMSGIFGGDSNGNQVFQSSWNNASKDLKGFVKMINN